MKRASGSMHIDDTSRHYSTAGGERRTTRCFLLRRSYRDENGKPRNETLANLSALPDNAIAALRLALKGATVVDAESVFDVERSISHGNVAAAHVMAGKLGSPVRVAARRPGSRLAAWSGNGPGRSPVSKAL